MRLIVTYTLEQRGIGVFENQNGRQHLKRSNKFFIREKIICKRTYRKVNEKKLTQERDS